MHCKPTTVFSLGKSQSFGFTFLSPNMSLLRWVTGSYSGLQSAEPGKGALVAQERNQEMMCHVGHRGNRHRFPQPADADCMQRTCRAGEDGNKVRTPNPLGFGYHTNLWWASKSLCGSTESSTSAIQVLKRAAAIHFCKPGSPVTTSSLLQHVHPFPIFSHHRRTSGVPREAYGWTPLPGSQAGDWLHFLLLWEPSNGKKKDPEGQFNE